MAPTKRTNQSKSAKDSLTAEDGAAYLRKLRFNELTAEFSRQERELKKLMRSLGNKLAGK